MKRTHGICLLCALLFVVCTPRSWAQSTQGAILGNVTDESGAAVPGATVEAKRQDIGFTRRTVTNGDGF